MDQARAADALVLACPEYNYSIAPALKNALDWLSREPDNVLLAGKAAAIMGAGGGMGTSRAQYHLRQVCVYLDLHVVNKPEIFSSGTSGAENGSAMPGLRMAMSEESVDWMRTPTSSPRELKLGPQTPVTFTSASR